MTTKHFAIMFLIALIAGSLGFFGGSTLASGKNNNPEPAFARNGAGGNFARSTRQGAGAGGGFINGTILTKDDQSITLKLQDGGSKIVFLSDTTSIDRMAIATPEDLTIGLNVMASGKTNEDGSITARMVQIRSADMPNMEPKPGQQ